MTTQTAKPFLKWAGGKTQLLPDISERIPFSNDESFTYIEPFLGSGAVLFWILNHYPNLKNVVANDINNDLINSYKTVKKDVHTLIKVLKRYEREYHALSNDDARKKEYYYNKRATFNSRKSDRTIQTALFIFLNKTCFNGLYRVNKKNQFNVPIGSYKKPTICDEDNLVAASKLLQKVTFLCGDFEETLKHAERCSLFYLDPPYKPISQTSSFNSYAEYEFNDSEQVRLKAFCDKLSRSGHKWILSNSDVRASNPDDNFFDELFSAYQIERVNARRSINSKANRRGNLPELLIANMEPA